MDLELSEEIANASWRKSPLSDGEGNCVEVATLAAGRIAVRDSKDPNGPALVFTTPEWMAFTGGVKEGAFDL
ncbi:protein of unknown function [Nonomuraea solani]|uniref:DUF397 domain-containing protein n=1 Tax=Nonomuraea solani TaxID=1144553 RepID=A0A1H6EZA4_9ACTN|nr:DUF397 domain-containing protein [Nonomuraea solani]SEH02431.1 protein of unknown function [Nonomuraea solani]